MASGVNSRKSAAPPDRAFDETKTPDTLAPPSYGSKKARPSENSESTSFNATKAGAGSTETSVNSGLQKDRAIEKELEDEVLRAVDAVKKRKPSCYKRWERVRHPILLNPSHPAVIAVRTLDMIVWIVYYLLMYYKQFDYLPEGPPFFNPLIETDRYFNMEHKSDLEYRSRHFINYSRPMYMWSDDIKAETYFDHDMSRISFRILNTPAGIWLLQVPIFIRLTLSFFVGFYDTGLPVRTWPQNAKYVRSTMGPLLFVSFPWQLLEILLRRSRHDPTTLDTLASDGLFVFTSIVGLFRITQFAEDLYWFSRFMGYFYNVLFFFFFGSLIENVVEFVWLMMPEFYCQHRVRRHTDRHMLLDCWSNNCSLFTINLEGNNSCYKETWWSLIHYNTRLTTTKHNVTNDPASPVLNGAEKQLESVKLVQSISNILSINNFHHFFVYTSTKGVGIGYGGATNHYEALFVIFMFAAGQYFYNWKISGFIDTIALAGDAGRVDDEKQLGIVKTFCKMHEADSTTVDVINQYCKDFQAHETRHMIETEAFRDRLPAAYQDLIMFPTLVAILKRQIRIFQDIGTHIQLCLAYQFVSQTYVRGDTVVKENEEPLGLMYIREGTMVAVHLDPKKGGVVRLHHGDFFGEISLNFNFVSPVMIKAVTNCEVFVLLKTDYQKILPLLPVHVQQKLVQNHADIINTSACRYHTRLHVKKPRIFEKTVFNYRAGREFSLEKLGLKMGLLQRVGGNVVPIHDEMPSYLRWIHAIGVLGLIAAVIAFIDIRPCDMWDAYFPCNPVSLFNCRFRPDNVDPFFNLDSTKVIAIASFLLAILFIVDLTLVLVAGINTPYGIISGVKAFKIKIGRKMGPQNYIKFIQPLYIGFKLLRFKDLLQRHLSFNWMIYITAALMLTLLVTVCHYGARFILGKEEVLWKSGICVYNLNEWQGDVFAKFDSIGESHDLRGLKNYAAFAKEEAPETKCENRTEMINNRTCQQYIPMLEVVYKCADKSDPACETLLNYKRNILMTQYAQHICQKTYGNITSTDVEGNGPYTSVYIRYLRVVYELLTIASAEGSDVTAYYVMDDGRVGMLYISIVVGIVLRGLADAYLLTIYSEEYSPTIHTYNGIRRIQSYMKELGTSIHASQAVDNLLRACHSTFNKITVESEAIVLHMLPVRLRRFTKERDTFMNLNILFFNPRFIKFLTENSKEFFFPPGLCCIYEGDLQARLMLIVRGYCFEIDEFGYYYFRGPGHYAGLTSLWTGHQSATVLCHTYVHCFIIEKDTLVRAFDIFGFTKRCIYPAIIASMPVMVTTTAKLEDFKVRHNVAVGESPFLRAMAKTFNFSNIHPTGICRSPSKGHWNCAHKTFLLYGTVNPHSKLGDAFLLMKMFFLLLSVFISSTELGFAAYKTALQWPGSFCDAVTILLCYVEWHIMYYDEQGVLVKDPVLATKRWFRTQGLVGILTTFPFEVLVVICYPPFADEYRLHFFGIKFFFRLTRYIPYSRTFTAYRKLHLDWTRPMIICRSTIQLFLVLHLFAIWWFLIQCRPEVDFIEHGDKTDESCSLSMWYKRLHDIDTINATWNTRSVISDNDHNRPLREVLPECGCLFDGEEEPCECSEPWRMMWDRYYSSGYQILDMNEGQSFIWMPLKAISITEHYGLSLYWSAQSVGTIGNGDINILDHEEMIWSYFLLMVGVLWFCFIMAEYTAVLVVYDELQSDFFILVAAQRAYLKKMGQGSLMSRVTQSEEMRFGSKVYLMSKERENLPPSLLAQVRLESLRRILPILVGEEEALTRGQLRLLALHLKRCIIPRGDFLVRDQDLVSSIYILAEGCVKVKYTPGTKDARRGSEEFEEEVSLKGENEQKNENAGKNRNKKKRGSPVIFDQAEINANQNYFDSGVFFSQRKSKSLADINANRNNIWKDLNSNNNAVNAKTGAKSKSEGRFDKIGAEKESGGEEEIGAEEESSNVNRRVQLNERDLAQDEERKGKREKREKAGEEKDFREERLTTEDFALIARVAEKAAPSTFEPGSCFGVTGRNDYEFWTSNVVAKVPCQVLTIDVDTINSMKEEFGFEWEEVLNRLFKNVEETVGVVMNHIAAVEMAKNKILKNRRRRKRREAGYSLGESTIMEEEAESSRNACADAMESYRNHRNIFHPAEFVVNLIFLTTSTFKLFAAMSGSLYVAFLGFEERWNDYQYWGWMKHSFIACMILSTVMTAGEIVFRFHLGFVEKKTGRVVLLALDVYDHYLKKADQMPLDIASLLPLWTFYYSCTPHFPQDFKYGYLVIAIRLSMMLLLLPIYIQAARGIGYFSAPAQCRPYSQTLLKIKGYIQLVLTVYAVFAITASLWILVGCPNGAIDFEQCDENGWIWIAYRTKPIKSAFHLLVNSFYFCMSTAVGAGVGDITGHNLPELYMYVLFMMAYALLNGGLQASIVSTMFATALREEKSEKRREEIFVAMSTYNMPKGIKRTVMNYMQLDKSYEFRLQHLFNDLHTGLKMDVHYALCKKFFKLLNLQSSVSIRRRLALYVEESIYLPGDLVIPLGGIIDEVHFVVNGRVRWSKDFGRRVKIIENGMLINDLSDIQVKPANFEVIAECVTFVYKLKFSTYCHLMLESSRQMPPRQSLAESGLDVGGQGLAAATGTGVIKPSVLRPASPQRGGGAAGRGRRRGAGRGGEANANKTSNIIRTNEAAMRGAARGRKNTSNADTSRSTVPIKATPENADAATARKGAGKKKSAETMAAAKAGGIANKNLNQNARRGKPVHNIGPKGGTGSRAIATPGQAGGLANKDLNDNASLNPEAAYGCHWTYHRAGSNETFGVLKTSISVSDVQNALKASINDISRNKDEDLDEEEMRWLHLMEEEILTDENEDDFASFSFDVDRLRRHLDLLNNFTEAEKKMMREVEVWARLISTIKAQINPTGSDQVATILAWEAFQMGFHRKEAAPVIIGPDEKVLTSKGSNKKKKKGRTYNYNQGTDTVISDQSPYYSHLITRKSKFGKLNPNSKIPAKGTAIGKKSGATPTTASGGITNGWPAAAAARKATEVDAAATARQSKLYAKESVDMPKVKIKRSIARRNRNANNNGRRKQKLLNYVGQNIMQQMLDKEPKSPFQKAREKFYRKIKSMDDFYEDELKKRPDWEKIIHDAEVD